MWLHRHSFNRDFGGWLLRNWFSKSVIFGSATADRLSAIIEFTLKIAPEAKFAILNTQSWYPVV
jgi:hypothetical protein